MKSFYKMNEKELERAELFLGFNPVHSDEEIKNSIYFEMTENANYGMNKNKILKLARSAWEEDDQHRYRVAEESVAYL